MSFFSNDTKVPFEVGDIIVGSKDGGFLRRVLAVNQEKNKIVTDTEFVSLAEAIDNGTLDGAVTFTPNDFARSNVPLAKAGNVTIDLSGTVIYDKDGLKVSIPSGTITYAPDITLKANFANHKLTGFKAVTEGDLTVDMTVRVQATGTVTLSKEFNIIPAIVKPFVFYIGPVPVAGTASLSFPFGISGTVNGGASIESGFDATTYVKLGTELNNGQWTDLNDFGSFEPNAHPAVLSFSSGAGIDVYVKPNATLNLYGASNLTGYVQPYLSGDATFVPSPFTFVLTAGINGGISYELKIFQLSLVNKDWYFPGPQWELYRYSAPYDVPTTFTFTLPVK